MKIERVRIVDIHGNVAVDEPIAPQGASEVIEEHNEDEQAHPDLRESIADAEAAAETYADGKVSTHDSDQAAHGDIRNAVANALSTANSKVAGVKRNGTPITPVEGVVDVEVPTKVSDLQNDADYQTEGDVKGYAVKDLVVVSRDGQTENSKVVELPNGQRVVKLDESDLGKIAAIKVNGTEQTIDQDGKVDIPVPTSVSDLSDGDDYATKTETQAMVDEAKVTSAEVNYQEDGGSPTAQVDFENGKLTFDMKNMKMKFSELSPEEKAALVGPTGPAGADRQPVESGDVIIAHTTGNDDGKVMSQKAISEILGINIDTSAYTFDAIPSSTKSIYYNTNVPILAGQKFRMSIEGLGTVISSWRYTLNNDTTTQKNPTVDKVELVATTNITTINIQVLAARVLATGTVTFKLDLMGLSDLEPAVDDLKTRTANIEVSIAGIGDLSTLPARTETLEGKVESLEGGMESIDNLNEYNEAISKQLDMQKIVPECTWNSGQLGINGLASANSNARYTSPIEVKRNDIIHIRGYKVSQYTFMAAWVVVEDMLYDGIYKYPSTSDNWYEITTRALSDGYISVCVNKNYTPTIEIWRGMDEGVNDILPNYLRVPQNALFANNPDNLFSPNQALNGAAIAPSASSKISFVSGSWVTGFMEIPTGTRYIRSNFYPERIAFYDASGEYISSTDGRSPFTVVANGKYIRLSFPEANLPYASRHRLNVTTYKQETDHRPNSTLNPRNIGIKDMGVFQLSDLASYAAELVFGTYVDATTFDVDGEPVAEFDAYKAYIDNTSWTLYRWDGEALYKACMWTDRGKVFTRSFAFFVPKTWHKENMIITATAKWVGTTAPTIRMTTMPNGGQLNLIHTMKYDIGAKDNYSTKEWRPYNCLIHQDRVRVSVEIDEGTTLMVDEFTNYYSDKIVRGSYPQFHFRSGNGLNQGLTAWEEAAKLGYEYIIVIPKRTADGKWVIFHDDGDINSMYNEDGTKVTNSSPIGNYTYEQLMQYDIGTGIAYGGNKLPLLEDFFALCAKRGIHPCFSVHPNFTTEEWQEVRILSDKWGVTKHLNIKAGFMRSVIDACYSVFGDDIESYMTDMNTSNQTARDTDPQVVVTETLNWSANIDKTKVRVGIEYFKTYAKANWIKAAIDAGLCAAVVTDNPNAAGSGGDSAQDILNWIDMGVSSFTDVINPSVGLNW